MTQLVLNSACVCWRPSWTPKTQPNSSSAVVWLIFCCSIRFTGKKCLSQRGETCRLHSYTFGYVVFGQPLKGEWNLMKTIITEQMKTLLRNFFFCVRGPTPSWKRGERGGALDHGDVDSRNEGGIRIKLQYYQFVWSISHEGGGACIKLVISEHLLTKC